MESILYIKRVVPVIARKETTRIGDIESYGLDSLLSTTEELLDEIAQKAIMRAVNAKANAAYGWCGDGCAKVLTTQLTAQFMPIPFLKTTLSSGIQVGMLADISKTFGYQFDKSILTGLCAVELKVLGFDSFIEEALKNLPGIDYDNIQTVQDVLSHFATMLEHVAGALPYKEQLLEMLKHISDSAVSGLPVLTCLTAIATTLSTRFLAVAFIETMKIYKTAEYEGQPMPELKEVLIEQMQLLMEFIYPFMGGRSSSGFA